MAQLKNFLLIIFVHCCCFSLARGQSTIPAAGGNADGSGGTASYSVGQITWDIFSGETGSVAPGVQQPYEIFIVTAIKNTEGITLEYKVYPNPSSAQINLTIKPLDAENFRYRLYDLNGILLIDKLIESDLNEIEIEYLPAAVYLLIVMKGNTEIKTFRIIKN